MIILLFVVGLANFQSDKMEILNTDEGRITVFTGNVVITEEKTRITSQTAAFHQTKNYAVISDTVVIQTPEARITADTAYYDLKADKTVLKGHPTIYHQSQVIRADTLVFDHRTERSYTDALVVITDSTKHLTVEGRNGEYNMKTEIAHLRTQPVLTIKKDSIITVTSREIDFFGKAGFVQAVGDAHLTSGKTVVACDSLVYYYDKNTGQALGSPKINEGNNSATSDTLRFYTDKETLTRIELVNNALGNYVTDDGDRVEVKGEEITISFDKNKVNRIEVERPTLGNLYRHKKAE